MLGAPEDHLYVAGWVGTSFLLMVLYAGICIVLVFSVVGDLEPTDTVEGAKDTNHMITPGRGLPHMSSGSHLELPAPSRRAS